MRKRHMLLWLALIMVLTLAQTAAAQDGVRISLAVPDDVAETLEAGLLDTFEASTGVSVYIIETGGGRFGRGGGTSDVDGYLDGIAEDVTEADVLLVNASSISPEATRAGYYLDMSPLVNVDTALNTADYYPAIWQSYQWDGGVWALPVAADVAGLLYNPEAFDLAGLAYPTENWTLYDLDNAARALTTYDDAGEIDVAGLNDMGSYMPVVVLNMIGGGVYDDSGLLSVPSFDNPALEEPLTLWADLLSEGYMTSGFSGGFDSPLMLAPSVFANNPRMAGEREFIGLPGQRSGLDVSAFAISGGTLYPEQAYALASFLTMQPDVVNRVSGVVPARQSIAGTSTEEGSGQRRGQGASASPELIAQLQPIIANAMSVSEARFSDALSDAVNVMVSDSVDAGTALQDVTYTALTNLEAADAQALNALQVAAPPAEVILNAGEVALNFGIGTSFGGNNAAVSDIWDSVIADFTANDAEVAHVEYGFERGFADVSELATSYDCFYLPSNAVQGADLSAILSLDPLMTSDPTFDPNDLVGNTLMQVQRDNQTWAMPLMLQPEALLYNADLFNQNGALLPANGWTVADFENALRTIKLFPDDAAPFIPQENSNNYMLLLLAAYGGVPVDYSTSPPTITFTDANAVAAARQILDLAKEGYIEYDGLSGAFGGRGMRMGFGSEEEVALYNQTLNSFVIDNVAANVSYGLTTYPEGAQLNGISYDIGTAYISTNTDTPEACYRFISTVAQHPELFDGMPARTSQINSPIVLTTQGQSAVDFYNIVNDALNQPNTLIFPAAFSGGVTSVGDTLAADWMYQAFDAYTLEDADLDAELVEAQLKAETFLTCYAALPAFDPNTQDPGEYFEQVRTCAVQADPDIEGQF